MCYLTDQSMIYVSFMMVSWKIQSHMWSQKSLSVKKLNEEKTPAKEEKDATVISGSRGSDFYI